MICVMQPMDSETLAMTMTKQRGALTTLLTPQKKRTMGATHNFY